MRQFACWRNSLLLPLFRLLWHHRKDAAPSTPWHAHGCGDCHPISPSLSTHTHPDNAAFCVTLHSRHCQTDREINPCWYTTYSPHTLLPSRISSSDLMSTQPQKVFVLLLLLLLCGLFIHWWHFKATMHFILDFISPLCEAQYNGKTSNHKPPNHNSSHISNLSLLLLVPQTSTRETTTVTRANLALNAWCRFVGSHSAMGMSWGHGHGGC